MASSSVLGKRARSSTGPSHASSPITTRSKRRTLAAATANDENENPFVGRGSREAERDGDGMDVDELAAAAGTSPSKVSRDNGSVPPKHTVTGERIALSPTKIHNHFRVTKQVSEENVRITQTLTPQTPRHRDALSKKVPVTPRHRVSVVGKPLTPKTPRTPGTPSRNVPTVYNTARQLFARSANPGRLVGRDDERKDLTTFIRDRLDARSGGCIYVSGPPGTGKSALVNEVSGSFGDDRSVNVTSVNCMSMRNSKDVYGKLVEDFCEGFDDIEGDFGSATLQKMFVGKNGSESTYIVTLDEVDHLLTADLELLYTLFEWSLHRDSRLVLVGIANALDLTDRFLPRLKARNLKPHLLPFLPYTAPQIASVITTKLKSTLSLDSTATDYVPFIHPAAIQLCSRKIAGQTGDLRKAFDICRRAIDLVEDETRQKSQQESVTQLTSPSKSPLAENTNLSSPPSPSKKGKLQPSSKPSNSQLMLLTAQSAPRVTIAHVARLSSTIFGNNTLQRVQSLNLQQKAALCALIALEKRKRAPICSFSAPITPSKLGRSSLTSMPTIRTLYETYAGLCRSSGQGSTGVLMLHPLTSTEFRDVVGNLETLSLVNVMDGGGAGSGSKNGGGGLFGPASNRGNGTTAAAPRKRKVGGGGGRPDDRRVGSCVGEQEFVTGIKGTVGEGILQGILDGQIDDDGDE
ncbi:MAG: AAA ATPase [Sclerophora amabilis]|nr:MAG: AAA ATPase [Sclerophora amabilis]